MWNAVDEHSHKKNVGTTNTLLEPSTTIGTNEEEDDNDTLIKEVCGVLDFTTFVDRHTTVKGFHFEKWV